MRLKPLKKESAEEKQKKYECGHPMFVKNKKESPLNGNPNQMNHFFSLSPIQDDQLGNGFYLQLGACRIIDFERVFSDSLLGNENPLSIPRLRGTWLA